LKAHNSFINYSILSASSQDADWPASSLKIYDSSTESFRNEDTNTLIIIIDLLASYANPHLLIYRSNFGEINFYGNSSDSWASPPFTLSGVTIEKDPEHFIYKRRVTLTGFNYRFLKVEIPSQTPIDGAGFFELGVLAIFETLEDFGASDGAFGLPVDTGQVIAESINRYETNRKDVLLLSDRPVLEMRLSGNFLNSISNRRKVAEIFGDPQKPLIYMDRGDVNSFQVYLMQRTGQMTTSEGVPGNAGVRSYAIIMESIL